jgi:hypothetical protein
VLYARWVRENLALSSVVVCSDAGLSVGFFAVASCGKSHREGRIKKTSINAANRVRVPVALTSQLSRVSLLSDGGLTVKRDSRTVLRIMTALARRP